MKHMRVIIAATAREGGHDKNSNKNADRSEQVLTGASRLLHLF